MANRKFLIESIIGLAQKLGANPSKFMGTKSNINFLGTGDRSMKGTTFSGLLNEEMIGATNTFGKSDLVKIIEQDAGYVTAGKLNDVQLNTMFTNLKTIDKTFNPPPLPPGPMNVIDLETGTRNINKEGLMSLRQSDDVGGEFVENTTGSVMVPDKRGPGFAGMEYKTKEGIETLKTKSPFRGSGKAADEVQDIIDQKFGKGYFDDVATKAKSEEDFIKSGAADFGDSVAAEGGRRAVVRQVMKNNANYFGLTPEVAESFAKSKDLGKGGSNFPDPLIVFRNKGNFTRQELEQIDSIIEANPFDDVKVIADKVSDYLQSIRPDGFADGGRIGYRSGGIGKGIMDLIKGAFGKSPVKKSNVVLNETLTQNETKYLKELIEDTGGGQFTSDIMDEVPSLKIIDNKITIDKKDIDSLSNFLDDMYISDLAPSGRGVDKMPPRLRDTNNNLLIKLLRNEKAEGGRIGFRGGKSVKDGIAALLKLGNKKFGKDTLKTADEVEPSEFAKFNERNKLLDDADVEMYSDELGDSETWYQMGMTVKEADELVKNKKIYEADMFQQYKMGKLDPVAGDKSPARMKFLQKKAEDAEMSGDSRLFTPDEADELTMLEASSPANVESALGAKQYGGLQNAQVPVEMMTVDIIKVKYPQIPDEMAEMIASLPNDKKALALADLEQAIMLQGTGRSSDEIIEIMKREPETKMKKGGLAQILEM